MRVLVLNGWAASPQAWDLCGFLHRNDAQVELHSYIDELDGKPDASMRALPADEKALLVGWSMGASYALKLACDFPERVAGLVLVAPPVRMMQDAPDWKGMTPRRLEALHKGLLLTGGGGFFGSPEGKPNPFMLDSEVNLERGLKYLLETDLRARVREAAAKLADVPMAFFHSVKDGIVASGNSVWLSELFPRAKLTVVDGAEHALPIFINDQIDAAVESMVRRPLILASKSPRRAKILEGMGIPFEVKPSDSDEVSIPHAPKRTVTANALMKLEACRKDNPGREILAADTIVWFGNRIYGKPRDLEEAKEFLRELSGQVHSVFTGVAYIGGGLANAEVTVVESKVKFRELTEAQIDEYVARVKPTDRAGAYDIDESGDLIVESHEGSYENIMGLPEEPVDNWYNRR